MKDYFCVTAIDQSVEGKEAVDLDFHIRCDSTFIAYALACIIAEIETKVPDLNMMINYKLNQLQNSSNSKEGSNHDRHNC